MRRIVLLLTLLLLVVRAVPAFSLPLLEEILNSAKLGAHTSARDESRYATIEPDKPVGQTFVVGDAVQGVFRIAIWQAFWHETWQPDEKLVLTLWDSPSKKVSYGRYAIPYSWRMWEGAVPMFTLQAKLQPNRSYYFELTVEVEPLHPAVIPREWTLGAKRPGFAGGDGVIAGIGIARDDYPQGTAYVAGQPQDYDLWFEVHEIHHVERDKLYEEAFGYFNLDYPPLREVREAVERRNWGEAVRRLVTYFESRDDLIPPASRQPTFNPDFDTKEADLACEHKVLLPDGVTVDLGPFWNHYTLWPERGGVGLTRTGLRKALASGYANTGNEKYARAFSDMLYHLFRHCPSPLRAGVWKQDQKIPGALPAGLSGGSMWSALAIGARMGHGFAYYGRFVQSPFFPLEIRAAFIFNLGEMAEVLERMEAGGNWETQIADTLLEFGLTYPEFRGAKGWIQQGTQKLIQNALDTVRPDGVLQEPTTGYHLLVMARYRNLVKIANDLGISLPQQMVTLTEKMHEYVMYATLPDGTLPIWGDGNPIMRPDMLPEAADIFGREDFRFVGTGGKAGKPPSRTSAGFPHGGFFYMRNSWLPDSHYMGIRCGPHGSHGHWDALSVIVSAFGRLLLIDPGVYIYGTPEAQELSHTKSHNTLTVGERRTLRNGIPDLWVNSARFDFFAGHNDGFEGLPNVQHYRRIWFFKPYGQVDGLWLILDDVIGEGEQEAQVWFRFASVPVEADEAQQSVWTKGEGGNLYIQSVNSRQIQLAMTKGIAVPEGGRLTEVPVARFSQKGRLPLSFTTLLYPYRGEQKPNVKTLLPGMTPQSPSARAVWIESGAYAWLVVVDTLSSLRDSPSARTVTLPDRTQVTTKGTSTTLQFIRQGNRWQAQTLLGVRLQEVRVGNKTVFRSDQPQDMVAMNIR